MYLRPCFGPGSRVAALILSVTVAACATAPEGEVADDANQDAGATPAVTEDQRAMSQLALGRSLADYGLEHDAPLALAAAAEILMGVRTDRMEVTPDVEAGADFRTDEEAPDPEDLLDEAERLAAGNEAILGAVRRVRQRLAGAARGALRGPSDAYQSVGALGTNRYRITFRGQERAIVYINGIDRTDLDLYVYDENGYFIGRSISYNDEERVSWVPRWTGPFTIEVRNLGSTWNNYYIAHN